MNTLHGVAPPTLPEHRAKRLYSLARSLLLRNKSYSWGELALRAHLWAEEARRKIENGEASKPPGQNLSSMP